MWSVLFQRSNSIHLDLFFESEHWLQSHRTCMHASAQRQGVYCLWPGNQCRHKLSTNLTQLTTLLVGIAHADRKQQQKRATELRTRIRRKKTQRAQTEHHVNVARPAGAAHHEAISFLCVGDSRQKWPPMRTWTACRKVDWVPNHRRQDDMCWQISILFFGKLSNGNGFKLLCTVRHLLCWIFGIDSKLSRSIVFLRKSYIYDNSIWDRFLL